jgi:hypothetical protein
LSKPSGQITCQQHDEFCQSVVLTPARECHARTDDWAREINAACPGASRAADPDDVSPVSRTTVMRCDTNDGDALPARIV